MLLFRELNRLKRKSRLDARLKEAMTESSEAEASDAKRSKLEADKLVFFHGRKGFKPGVFLPALSSVKPKNHFFATRSYMKLTQNTQSINDCEATNYMPSTYPFTRMFDLDIPFCYLAILFQKLSSFN